MSSAYSNSVSESPDKRSTSGKSDGKTITNKRMYKTNLHKNEKSRQLKNTTYQFRLQFAVSTDMSSVV